MAPRDIFLAVLITFVWGLNFVVIHIGIDAFPPLMFSALRFIFAAFPLIFLLPKPATNWRYICGIGLILGVVKFALLFVGMHIGLSAGLASIILQSQAFFTVLLVAIVFKETPGFNQVVGIVIAFSGIAIIVFTLDGKVTVVGLLMVLAAGFAWAVSNLLMKKAGTVDMLALMVWISVVPPVPLIMLSLWLEGWRANAVAFAALDVSGLGAIGYIAYLATILGFAGWGRLIRLYGAGRVAPFSLLVPVFGMGSSAFFLGEQFEALRLSAVVLVFVGLAVTLMKPKAVRLGKTRPNRTIFKGQ